MADSANPPFLRSHRKTVNIVSLVFGFSHIFFAVLNFVLEVPAIIHSELGVTLGTGFVSFVALAVSGSFTIAIYYFKQTRLHQCSRWTYAITAIVIGVCIMLNVAELLNQNKDPNIPRYLQLRIKSAVQLGSHFLCVFVDIFLSTRSHCFYEWKCRHPRQRSEHTVRYEEKSETVSLPPKESRSESPGQAISPQAGPSGLAEIVEEEPSAQAEIVEVESHEHAVSAQAGPSGRAIFVKARPSGHSDAAEVDRLKKQSASN